MPFGSFLIYCAIFFAGETKRKKIFADVKNVIIFFANTLVFCIIVVTTINFSTFFTIASVPPRLANAHNWDSPRLMDMATIIWNQFWTAYISPNIDRRTQNQPPKWSQFCLDYDCGTHFFPTVPKNDVKRQNVTESGSRSWNFPMMCNKQFSKFVCTLS